MCPRAPAALRALAASLALAACSDGPAPQPAGAQAPRAVLSMSSAGAGESFDAARAAAGLGPLRRDPRLDRAAQEHADWIARTGAYGHRGANGSRVTERLRAEGHCGLPAAENLAHGFRTVAPVLEGWLGSPGHRRNLLYPGFGRYGMGQSGGYWVLVLGGAC